MNEFEQCIDEWAGRCREKDQEIERMQAEVFTARNLAEMATGLLDSREETIKQLQARVKELEHETRHQIKEWALELGHPDGVVSLGKLKEMQAQEIERLTKKCNEQADLIAIDTERFRTVTKRAIELAGAGISLETALKILSENQEELNQQLAAAQARIMELEEIVERDTSRILKYQSQASQLQATIAAREEVICRLRVELDETWVDERETVWTRPTAWAYAMVCKARDKHAQDAARLREALERIVIEAKKEPSIIGVVEVHSIAHRALKGSV